MTSADAWPAPASAARAAARHAAIFIRVFITPPRERGSSPHKAQEVGKKRQVPHSQPCVSSLPGGFRSISQEEYPHAPRVTLRPDRVRTRPRGTSGGAHHLLAHRLGRDRRSRGGGGPFRRALLGA